MSEDTRLRLERVRPRLARRTIRLRLAVLFLSVFLASGVVLLGVTVAVWQSRTGDVVATAVPVSAGQNPATGITQHGSDRHELLIASAIALAIMAGLSLAVGWGGCGTVPAAVAHDHGNDEGDLRYQAARAPELCRAGTTS